MYKGCAVANLMECTAVLSADVCLRALRGAGFRRRAARVAAVVGLVMSMLACGNASFEVVM